MRKIKYIPSKDPRSEDFNNYIVKAHSEFVTEEDPDLILVTGGDGAMLHAIQAYSHYSVPFIGYAAGTLNYLMNNVDEPKRLVESLLRSESKLHISETTSIKVDLISAGGKSQNMGYAVNEVVFGRDIMGYHSYSITSADGSFADFKIKGSGISICTDLGSTGYNFNLGGSVLPLGSNLWSIVGVVCNHYLNDILHIQKIEVSDSVQDKTSKFSIFIDGIKKRENLEQGQIAVFSKGMTIKIAFLNKIDFIRRRVDIVSRYRKS